MMNNFLDTIITVFENAMSPTGCDMRLGDFLNGTVQLELIEQIRATAYKKERQRLKQQLWCATISARCEAGRKETDPYTPTGLLCVDIDGQDNSDFPDAATLKSTICKVAEVLYCALSVSGNGCFAIIRLATPSNFEGHFKAVARLFRQRLGINIDTQCSNIKRLRYVSYDPEPYINHDAPALRVIDYPEVRKCDKPSDCRPTNKVSDRNHVESATSSYIAKSEYDKVEEYVTEIERMGIDITIGYDNWFRIGMALTNLGESGRELFHRVSRLNPGYNHAEADKKYTELMRTTRSVNIGTFFHICQDAGIRIK